MKINIGIRYGHLIILLELEAFEKYINRLERVMKYLCDQEPLRTSHILRRLQDPIDKDLEENALSEFQVNIIPRFFRNPALVSLYAIWETAVIEIASDLRQLKREPTQLADIKKGSLLDKSKKYFNEVLKVSLCSDSRSLEQLEMLGVIRNAIAHCNGRLEKVKPKNKKKIEDWISSDIGVSETEGDLLISKTFLKNNYRVVKDTVHSLITQLNALSNEGR